MLVFGMVLSGCDNGNGSGSDDDGDNPFKGTWNGNVESISVVIGDSTFEVTGNGWKQKGTYTYKGNTGQITITHIDTGSGWTTDPNDQMGFSVLPTTYEATITGTEMTINGSTLTKSGGNGSGSDDDGKTPFEGSWKGWNGDSSNEKIWAFSGNEFTVIILGQNNAKGTFTYTATTITLVTTHQWNDSSWEPWSHTLGPFPYTIIGNNLTIEGDGDGRPFVKTN
jgi:hypothetical protein